ncbi:MAG: type IV pilus secretin PilQ [Desulfobacter sp.]
MDAETNRKKQMYGLALSVMMILCLAGCNTLEKRVGKQDRFEKWRILAENSKGNTPTPKTYELPAAPVQAPAQDPPAVAAPVPSAPEKQPALPDMPVSMQMHDVPVSVLLRTLARIADVNVMINDTVTGKAKINISKLPWDKAFVGVLKTHGLTYQWADGILRVITVEDLNREIALMEARQKCEKSKKQHSIAMMAIQKETEKLDPLITKIVKIDYTDLKPLRDNLEKYLLSSKKDIELTKGGSDSDDTDTDTPEIRGAILMDESSNALVIHATASDIKRIIPIIEELDRPSEQILIECHIVEANSDVAKELGVQWGGLGLHTTSDKNTWLGGPFTDPDTSLFVSSDDATDDAPAGSPIIHLPNIGTGINFPSSDDAGSEGWNGMSLGIMHQNIGNYLLYAQLTALEQEGQLNILSNPSITTMDHRKAIIESGKEVPFQTIEDDEVKIEFKKAVIKLEVTPHVINNEVVRLDILTHKDELDWTHTVAGNPTIITKNAETRVNLFDGQTTVIGGLTKEKILESETGVPYLKDLPGIGRLFRSNADGTDMEELLIFITPHILKERISAREKGDK